MECNKLLQSVTDCRSLGVHERLRNAEAETFRLLGICISIHSGYLYVYPCKRSRSRSSEHCDMTFFFNHLTTLVFHVIQPLRIFLSYSRLR